MLIARPLAEIVERSGVAKILVTSALRRMRIGLSAAQYARRGCTSQTQIPRPGRVTLMATEHQVKSSSAPRTGRTARHRSAVWRQACSAMRRTSIGPYVSHHAHRAPISWPPSRTVGVALSLGSAAPVRVLGWQPNVPRRDKIVWSRAVAPIQATSASRRLPAGHSASLGVRQA